MTFQAAYVLKMCRRNKAHSNLIKKFIQSVLASNEIKHGALHMKNKQLTIIIQPEAQGCSSKIRGIRSYSIPKRFFGYFAVAIVLLLMFGISGGIELKQNMLCHAHLQMLNGELVVLREVVAEVDTIRSEERIIRDFLGIEALNYEFDINDRMGKGGTWAAEDGMEPYDLVTEIETIDESGPLHMRVHDLREDMHQLIMVLSKLTETLKCRPTVMPVKEDSIWITSGFGWRKSPFTGLREFHNGLDISGRKGAPIIATADGVVSCIGYNRFIGNYVNIDHDERFKTSYGHLHNYIVDKNQNVKRGEIIGYMGTTGMSTGYHLHYEVIDNGKKVNPHNFILNRKELMLASSR